MFSTETLVALASWVVASSVALGLAWRLTVFVSAAGAGYLASGAVIRRRGPIVTLKQAAVSGGLAAAAFSIVGSTALVILVVIGIALA